MLKKTFGKILSKFTGLNINVKQFDIPKNEIKINSDSLEIKKPDFNEFFQTYVFIRNLITDKSVKINILPKLENLIKWKVTNLNYIVTFRKYALQFFSTLKFIDTKKLALTFPQTKNISEKNININKKIKIMEELIEILPYTKKINRQKLFRVPITRSPVYRLNFTDNEMRKFREDLASQNKTRWTNVEIIEIYDKFNIKLFSDVKQIPGSRNLLFYPSYVNSNLNLKDTDFYYLIIGKRKDNSEFIRALSKQASVLLS